MKTTCSIVFFIFLWACASAVGTQGNATVKVVERKQIENCEYLGDVHATSPFYGVFASSALEATREAALSKAAIMGANSLVWNANETGYGSTSVHADAYKCK